MTACVYQVRVDKEMKDTVHIEETRFVLTMTALLLLGLFFYK